MRTPGLRIGEKSSFVLIAYDIRDDKIRTRLLKMLKGYGERVQYSVFEAWITPAVFKILKKKIAKLIDLEKDSVRYYHLCDTCVKRIELEGMGGTVSHARTMISLFGPDSVSKSDSNDVPF